MGRVKVQESTTSTPNTVVQSLDTDTNKKLSTIDSAIVGLTCSIGRLEERIIKLEKKQKPEEAYFKSAKRNLNVSLLVYLLLPITQLGLTIICLNFLLPLPNNKMVEVYNWVIAFIGLGSIVELFYVPYKFAKIEDRIDQID